MKASEGRVGRVFVIRLEDGDVIPECIERFAEETGISVGHAILVGGVGSGEVVVGPQRSEERPPQPMVLPVDGVHEVVGVGVLAPNEEGRPVLHLHAALGRSGQTISGCLRRGATTWLIGEVILYEVLGVDVVRSRDEESGFGLLDIDVNPDR
ncbi:PPC domain-containing DNA-binding protein [Chloroflexota bacterium]